MAGVPDGPPLWLRRRRERQRVVAAAGPERILPEWWRPGEVPPGRATIIASPPPDGAAFWVSRDGHYGEPRRPEWRVRGRFA